MASETDIVAGHAPEEEPQRQRRGGRGRRDRDRDNRDNRDKRDDEFVDKLVAINPGAFWMATGTSIWSMTAEKNSSSACSLTPATGGGCRITQAAPALPARRANSICAATFGSATVTASGTR